MDVTIQSDQAEAKTAKVMEAGSSRTYPSGDKGNTSSTVPEVEKLKNLSRSQALILVREELANLLIVYQNLGGAITAITLPEGKEILAHRYILVLPADKAQDGSFFLSVPE